MNRPLPPNLAHLKGSSGLPCPNCGGKTVVSDSRGHVLGLRRRRGCVDCGLRFKTFEQPAELDPRLAENFRRQLRAARERLEVALTTMAEVLDEHPPRKPKARGD